MQNSIKFIFTQGSSWLSKEIMKETDSNISHVATGLDSLIVHSSGRTVFPLGFQAEVFATGINNFHPRIIETVRIAVDDKTLIELMNFSTDFLGKDFDIWGIVKFWFRLLLHRSGLHTYENVFQSGDNKSLFCSELAYLLYKKLCFLLSVIPIEMKPEEVSPVMLLDILKKTACLKIEVQK